MTEAEIKTLKKEPPTLEPCPWCQGPAETRNSRWAEKDHWGVTCVGCGDPWFDCRADTEAEAIAAWNRRNPPASQDKALVEMFAAMPLPDDPHTDAWQLGFCRARKMASDLVKKLRLRAPNACDEIFNHKWLDPQCVGSGCQSLILQTREASARAEGKREGIEEAAKVADDEFQLLGSGRDGQACQRVRDRIRAIAEKQS